MNPVGIDPIVTFEHGQDDAIRTDHAGLPVAARPGHQVNSYCELLIKIATLHYYNPRFTLLFRGQGRDYKSVVRDHETIHSNLFPSLLRGQKNEIKSDLLTRRFGVLKHAEEALKARFPAENDIFMHQIVRWAVLQHYEVCPTPLLDVTYSLQSALSFAAGNAADVGYLYVFAVPQVTGPISTSIESLTQVIDLTRLCPPTALRPHFQSAVLIGDYPIITSTDMTHEGKAMIGNNFSCRLLAKFQLCPLQKWSSEGFHSTPSSILFPNDRDTWYQRTQEIRKSI